MNTSNKQDIVYQQFIKKLRDGVIYSGEILSERNIARDFECGRTVAKSVLNRLLTDGYIEELDDKTAGGYVILEYDEGAIKQGLQIRALIELWAADKMFDLCDKDLISRLKGFNDDIFRVIENGNLDDAITLNHAFHRLFWEMVCLGPLSRTLNGLFSDVVIDRLHSTVTQEMALDAYEEHKAIIEALENGDKSKFLDLYRNHILDSFSLEAM